MNETCTLGNITGMILIPKNIMKLTPSNMSELFHGKTIIQTTKRGERIQYKLNKGIVKSRYLKRITTLDTKHTDK